MKYIFVYFFIMFFCNKNFSQNFKNQNFSIIDTQLSEITNEKDFFLIELAEKKLFVIIKDNEKKYLMLVYLIKPKGYFLEEVSYLKACKKLFKFSCYKMGYIDSDSEFYNDKNANFEGSNFCFALISKDRKLITETKITTLIDILPYDDKIHIYLLNAIGALPK